MESIYSRHKDIIMSLFINEDISFILQAPLKSNFNHEALERIYDAEGEKKIKIFFEEFEKIKLPVKYVNFLEVTTEVSEWIAALLISQDDGKSARHKYNVSKTLINEYSEFVVENLTINLSILRECRKISLISESTFRLLHKTLKEDGDLIVRYRLQSLLHMFSVECYSKFLQLCHKHLPLFLEVFKFNLHNLILTSIDEEETLGYIKVISASEIEEFIYSNVMETVPVDLESSSSELTSIEPTRDHVEVKAAYESDSDDSENDNDKDDDFNVYFGICEKKHLNDMLNFRSETPATDDDATLSTRLYQDELAKKGIEGNNVLICAPTSSGKTVVAIKITKEHLTNNPTGKVALVVPTTVLVDQQFLLFFKYLRKNYKINKLSGGSKSISVPLSKQIGDYDIFVFTPDILKNALEEQDEPLGSIGEFSLIIFDECHHTDKDHSYNKVMDYYFKNKQADLPVPQIIGMTASTGTDKATNVDAALKSLMSLCANLDCRIVTTVISNIEELNRNLPAPSCEIKTPGTRGSDIFEINLLKLMDSIESILEGIFRKKVPIGIPSDKYHDKYLSFVKSITSHRADLLSDEERKGTKIIELYLEYLYRALVINHLFNCSHAIEMLKEKIETKAPCTCNMEKDVRKQLEDFYSSTSLEQDRNPSLECLKAEIVKQMKEDKKSKIIVFVKEVLYTKILESEIQAARLGFIECKALVGTNKPSDKGGLSKSSTDDIVSRFRRGVINLLFTTSVAEEGLDVKMCNLVVRYGHVTNEISMVQTRGRARALDSKYIVIVPEKLKWQANKENVNKARENMMYQAIVMFQRMDLQDVEIELFKLQEKRLALRTGASGANNEAPGPRKSDTLDWTLLCNKCEKFICHSEDIRLANGTSYIVINKDTYPNLQMRATQPNKKPVVCSKCETVLGQAIKVEGVNVPTIKINQCLLRSGLTSSRCKQWKDSPFTVPTVSAHELALCQTDSY